MRDMRRAPRRAGFTLIELLIVVAIIAVLLALGAGAYFRVRDAQLEGATRVTLSKVSSTHDQHWKAETDQAKNDANDNANLVGIAAAMADRDSIRTRVIWTKLRQKMSFPQNFWEVLVWAPQAQQTFGLSQNPAYRNALAGISPITVLDPSIAATPAEIEQLHFESAALLYLALTIPRRGQTAGFDAVEHVGAHAVGDVMLYGKTFKVFQDTWRRPIAFIRWPFGAAGMDINSDPFVTRAGLGGPVVDPTDPERRLQVAAWQANYGQGFMNSLGHPLPAVMPANALNLQPVIFSGGRDKLYGVDTIYTRQSSDEDDNIYGYRVRRAGGR